MNGFYFYFQPNLDRIYRIIGIFLIFTVSSGDHEKTLFIL